MGTAQHRQHLHGEGFAIIDNVFTEPEVAAIIETIDAIDTSGAAFRKTSDLFAIRRFVKEVPGIMIMQPLLLHASNRTVNNNKRTVIHLEFSNRLLPGGLQWAEYLLLTDFTAIS